MLTLDIQGIVNSLKSGGNLSRKYKQKLEDLLNKVLEARAKESPEGLDALRNIITKELKDGKAVIDGVKTDLQVEQAIIDQIKADLIKNELIDGIRTQLKDELTDQVKADLKSDQTIIDQVKADLKANQTIIDQIKADLESTITEKANKFDQLQADLNSKEAEAASLTQKNQKLEAEKNALNTKVKQLESEKTALETKNKAIVQPKQSNAEGYTATVGVGLAAGLIAFTALEQTVKLEMLVTIGIAAASVLVAGGITYFVLKPSNQFNETQEPQQVNGPCCNGKA